MLQVIHNAISDFCTTWIEDILWCHWKASVFNESLAGIPLGPNRYHLANAEQQLLDWRSKVKQNFCRILYPLLTVAFLDPLR